MTSVASAAALTAAFLLELALLAGYAIWGYLTFNDGWRWVAMITAPIAVAVVWGLFLSPKAAVPLNPLFQFLLEASLFGGAFVALCSVGFALVGGIGLILWALDKIALLLLQGR
ncbi:YrdB family protein [Paenarthrobacter sp. PH39-S1]|uniref:YrdB family protein n=1 Tax=Paenarthrobacter sp. PH39-S1 TaxID=3046204 RepID=UPI0024BA153E|nr:YrdB family protein [Paenarthrobacter sp. PH39-S1]MDJ0356704.1 YrdB family protein [Paenarthrobacter sp. PH39-S1]